METEPTWALLRDLTGPRGLHKMHCLYLHILVSLHKMQPYCSKAGHDHGGAILTIGQRITQHNNGPCGPQGACRACQVKLTVLSLPA